MKKVLLLYLSIICLFGCKTRGTYEQTSRELAGWELINPVLGFYKSWAPVGSKDAYDMTDEQEALQSQALRYCINNLNSSYSNKVSHALRAVQLIECMESNGWFLVVEKLAIVR